MFLWEGFGCFGKFRVWGHACFRAWLIVVCFVGGLHRVLGSSVCFFVGFAFYGEGL